MQENKITLELKKTANAMKRSLDRKCPSRISNTQMIILIFIDDNLKNKKITYGKDIEDFLEIRRSSVSEILNGMEEKKLIKRNLNNLDLRTKEIILDIEGIKILNEFRESVKIIEEKLHNDLDNNELEIFFEVLKKIRMNLEDIC